MTQRKTAAALLAFAALVGGCAMSDEHEHEDDAFSASEEETQPVEAPPQVELPEWRKMWNFGDPAGTATRFQEAIAAGEQAGDRNYVLIVTTQLARTHGLRRDFDGGHAILDRVEAALVGASPEVKVRYHLERGRTLNSSGNPEQSKAHFEEAWDVARGAGLDGLAIDAAHMMAIVLPPEEQIVWSEKAMDLAEATSDEKAKGWLGPLYNNTGWTYHSLGNFERALELWEKSLAFRQDQGAQEETFIARWTIARCWRSMGRHQDALAEQKSILDDRAAAGMSSKGYCEEEIGENLLALDRADEAREWFGKAYDLLKDDKWMQADEPERLARMKELGGR